MALKLIQGKQLNVNLTGSFTGSFSGSFNGTGSYATQALTSSYALSSSYSTNITGSTNYVPKFTGTNTLGNSAIYNSGNNIGIGTTTPTSKLVVAGDGRFSGAVTIGSGYTLSFADEGSPEYAWIEGSSYDPTYSFLRFVAGGNEAFRITSAGNLVIGKTTANAKLDVNGNAIITGSLKVTNGITGSLYGTSSWAVNSTSASYAINAGTASNILGGKATHIPFFITDTTLATSSLYQSGSTSVIINQDNNTTANPEALYVWQPHPTSFNVISGKGNLNNYLQLNIQNTNQGTNASSDIVATANNGDETTNYIDMGINSENFTGALGGANDAYLYSTGKHLHIGNATPGQYVGFFAGGDDVDTNMKLILDPFNSHQITGSLEISENLIGRGGITGSLFGTASYALQALSASYALTSSFLTSGTNAFLQNGNSFGTTALLGTNDNQSLALETSGSERMRITSAGNVGIGATNPSYKLDVVGNSRLDGILFQDTVSDQRITGNRGYFFVIGGGAVFQMNSGNFSTGQYNTTAKFDIKGSGATSGSTSFLVQNSNASASLAVLGNGNVGIGTAAPSASLQVIGDFRLAAAADGTNSLWYYRSSNNVWSLNTTSGGVGEIWRVSGNTQTFYQVGTFANALNVTPGGNSTTQGLVVTSGSYPAATLLRVGVDSLAVTGSNVGIGKLAPNATLDVNGNAIITGSLTVTNGMTGSLFGTSSWAVSSSNAGTSLSSSFAATASYAPSYLPLTGGTITGNVTVTGTASIAFLNVQYESASVIYSSGSNVFGDASNDTQTLNGTVLVSGSQQITGSLNVSQGITGSLFGTASNIGGGTPNYIPLWNTSSSLSSSVLYQSASNIGIGTTTPAYKLDVSGSIRVTSGSQIRVDNATDGNYVSLQERGVLFSRTNGASIGAYITSSDNTMTLYARSGLSLYGGGNGTQILYLNDENSSANGSVVIRGTNTAANSGSLHIQNSANTQVFRVFNGGAVAIGNITTPSASLHIKGASTSSLSSSFYVENQTATASFVIKDDGSIGAGIAVPAYRFQVNTPVSTDAFAVTNGGSSIRLMPNAGLGNPGIASSGIIHMASPINGTGGTEVLQVRKAGGANFIQYWSSNAGVTLSAVDGTGRLGIGTSTTPLSASLHIKGATSSSLSSSLLVQNSNASASFTVLDNGFVGVGTATPTKTFDLVGTSLSNFLIRSGSTNMLSTETSGIGGSDFRLRFWNNANTQTLDLYGSGNYDHQFLHAFSISTVEKMRITAAGNVGIATTTPNATLDVNGSVNISGSGVQVPFQIYSGVSPLLQVSSSGKISIGSTTNAGYGLEVYNTGIFYAGQASAAQLLITTSGSVNREGAFIAASTGRTLQMGINDNSTVPVGIDMFATNNAFESSYLNFRVNNANLIRMTGSFVGIGTINPNATLDVNGNAIITGSLRVTNGITGSLFGTSSWAVSSSYSDSSISASFAVNSLTASYVNPLVQNVTITGSFLVSGSTTQIGNNTLLGNNTITGSNNILGNSALSGSITISGNTLITGSITALNQTASFGYVSASFLDITGKQTVKGYAQFLPTSDIVPIATPGGYIYSSGSQGDLYFAQTNGSINNVVRLRWIEGNMYSGLLNGGVISTQSSTVYQVSSGSGIIVSLNGSLSSDPYPAINYVNWNTLSASIAPLSASFDQSFVAIEASGSQGILYVQGTPYDNGQFNTLIPIGNVIHQNRTTINATATYPSVAYGYKQRSSDFIRAFGPLKLTGLDTIVSGSSTGSLQVTSGKAYSEGRNYVTDVNNPSYVQDTGQPVSKIFRYYQSGSGWVYQTNGGAGFESIDPTQYSLNGVLTPVPGTGANREFSIQRVFYFPGGATKGIYVYYGNQTYTTALAAIANIPYESFIEAPNTSAGAVLSAYLVVRNNADFTVADSYNIRPAGLFRNIGGTGGAGGAIAQTLSGLSDVDVLTVLPTNGQPLVYDSATVKWKNASSLTANLTGTASFATTASFVSGLVASASFATTSSNVLGGTANYIPLWNTNTSLTSSVLYQSASNIGIGTTLPSASLHIIAPGAGSANIAFRVANSTNTGNFINTDGAGITLISTPISDNSNAPLVVQNQTAYSGTFTQNLQLWKNSTGTSILSLRADGYLFVGPSGGNIESPKFSVAANGNASAPTITRSNNSTTGIFFPATNTIAVSTNSSERLRIDSTGNVAIGTTLPSASLHVRSATTSSLSSSFYVENSAATASFVIKDNGSVGIGTATPSATSKVHINLGTFSSTNDGIFVDGNCANNPGSTGVRFSLLNSSANALGHIRLVRATGTVKLGMEISSQARDGIMFLTHATTPVETMRLDANGNLGIGTTAPSASLHVQGAVIISQSLFQYSNNAAILSGSTANVASFPTSSYMAGFFDFVASSGTNARAGTIFTVWNGSSLEYVETSTNDIGSTTNLILSASLSGANVLLQGTSLSGSWNVKTLTRMI